MDFNDIIKKSSALMNMEKNGLITKKFGNKDHSDFNSRVSPQRTTIQESNEVGSTYSSVSTSLMNDNIIINNNTKLPKEIVESFKKSLAEEEAKNNELISKLVGNTKTKQHVIQETVERENDIVSSVNKSSKTDIKETIREVIREEISSLQILSLKDKINIITNNGDVYEVNLKYKKNIKDKH